MSRRQEFRQLRLRIDLGDGCIAEITASNAQKPLIWDLIAKIEEKAQRLHAVATQLEW